MKKGKLQFDIAEGFGFPSWADLKNKIGRENADSTTISNSISISDEDQENSMIVFIMEI